MFAPAFLRVVLQIFALVSLAFSVPLLSLLSENAEFLVAHDLSSWSLACAVLGLGLFLPLGAASAWAAFSHWTKPSWHVLDIGVFALGGLVALSVLAPLNALNTTSLLASSVTIGGSFTFLRARGDSLQSALVTVGALLLAYPAWVLLATPLESLREDAKLLPVLIEAPKVHPPIFFIVFDELTTASLIREDGTIDDELFPNFARLANKSTWLRNASAVNRGTIYALPAILSGTLPRREALPTVSEYPVNLFTLLGSSYEIHAFQTVTRLCPKSHCPQAEEHDAIASWRALAADVSVLYLHIIAPTSWRSALPTIATRWHGFGADDTKEDATNHANAQAMALSRDRTNAPQGAGRARPLEVWLDNIVAPADGQLHFIHSRLPHVPYNFLPDGRAYSYDGFLPGTENGLSAWGNQASLVQFGFQRYLLQVQYLDGFVGRFLDRLQMLGVLGDSLIVLTADHGVNFQAGAPRRAATPATYATALSVPLFIKLPGQVDGAVSESNVEHVDLLPTILSTLGAQTTQRFDGDPIFDENRLGRGVKRWGYAGEIQEFPPNLVQAAIQSAAALRAPFGRTASSIDLFNLQPSPGLSRDSVGTTSVNPSGEREVLVSIQNPALLSDVDLKATALPAAFIRGSLSGDLPEDLPLVLLELNRRPGALVRTYEDSGQAHFAALVDPALLQDGENDLRVHVVEQKENGPQLHAARTTGPLDVSPRRPPDPAGSTLELPNGRIVELAGRRPRGGIGTVEPHPLGLIATGWFIDPLTQRPVRAVLAFRGNKLIEAQEPFVEREGVATRFGDQALRSGVRLVLPSGPAAREAQLRIYVAFEDGSMRETPLPRTQRMANDSAIHR